jgi:tetratricopeptide (TPR) repeat protein
MKTEITDVLAAKQAEGAILEQAVIDEDMQHGIDAAQAGDKATAHQVFQRIAARNPGLVEAWIWLGGTSPSLDEAEAAFEKAHELDPMNEEANLGLRWIVLRRQTIRQTGTLGSSTATLSTGPLVPTAPPAGILSAPTTSARADAAKSSGVLGLPTPVMALIVLLVVVLAAALVWYALYGI